MGLLCNCSNSVKAKLSKDSTIISEVFVRAKHRQRFRETFSFNLNWFSGNFYLFPFSVVLYVSSVAMSSIEVKELERKRDYYWVWTTSSSCMQAFLFDTDGWLQFRNVPAEQAYLIDCMFFLFTINSNGNYETMNFRNLCVVFRNFVSFVFFVSLSIFITCSL